MITATTKKDRLNLPSIKTCPLVLILNIILFFLVVIGECNEDEKDIIRRVTNKISTLQVVISSNNSEEISGNNSNSYSKGQRSIADVISFIECASGF